MKRPSDERDRELTILLDGYVPNWRMYMEDVDWSEFVRLFRESSGKSRATAYKYCKEAARLWLREKEASGATVHLWQIPGTNLFAGPPVAD